MMLVLYINSDNAISNVCIYYEKRRRVELMAKASEKKP